MKATRINTDEPRRCTCRHADGLAFLPWVPQLAQPLTNIHRS
jgi:hypothetical protein